MFIIIRHHYMWIFFSFIIQFDFVCISTPVLQPVSVQALCSLLSCICWFSKNVPRAFRGRCIGGLVCQGGDMSRWLSGHAWPSLLCLCVQLYIYSWGVLVAPVYSTLKNWVHVVSVQVIAWPYLWPINYGKYFFEMCNTSKVFCFSLINITWTVFYDKYV